MYLRERHASKDGMRKKLIIAERWWLFISSCQKDTNIFSASLFLGNPWLAAQKIHSSILPRIIRNVNCLKRRKTFLCYSLRIFGDVDRHDYVRIFPFIGLPKRDCNHAIIITMHQTRKGNAIWRLVYFHFRCLRVCLLLRKDMQKIPYLAPEEYNNIF